MINKEKVKNCFKKSINTYNANATVQEKICLNFTNKLKNYTLNTNEVIEIGCGTGLLTNLFLRNFAPNKYIINDIVEENKNSVRPIFKKHNFSNWQFLPGDAENLNFENNLDLIISTSTFQWFNDFNTFITKAYNSLSPGGTLAFTSFGPNNLKEIRRTTNSGLKYLSTKEIREILLRNFIIKEISEENHTLLFNEPIQILKHMKLTGVNGNSNKRWKPSDLKEFENKYRQINTKNNKFELSYNPIYIIAQKPNN